MEKFDLQFLQSELVRTSGWIEFSDKKVAFLSAFHSAVFGLICYQKDRILQNFSVLSKTSLCLYLILLVGIAISFFVGVSFLVKSIFPKLKNSLTNESLFYFGHVANMKFVDYSRKIKSLTVSSAKEQIIEQIYTNSLIANQKMKNIQRSIKSSLVLISFVTLLIFVF